MISPKHIVKGIAIEVSHIGKAIFDPDIAFTDHREVVQSYSQFFDDLLVDAILGCKPTGTYVDIGANDPTLFNNTKRFYDRGWCGINIEPNPQHFPTLMEQRPRDINLNIGISDKKATIPFYILDADMASTMDKEHSKLQCFYNKSKVKSVLDVPVERLDTTLDKYLGERKIDFMSIDVEGHDMAVLRGNDWEKYRPYLILVELAFNPTEITDYLISVGYTPVLFSNRTNAIFIDAKVA